MKVMLHQQAEAQVAGVLAQASGTVLLHGEPHVGKRTLAYEVARRLNCSGCKTEDCRSCRQFAGGNHPNIIGLYPDAKQKIGVDAVHELQHSLHYTQYSSSGIQVVVITAADRLTIPAQNALLKTLEEPPLGTLIILTATTPSALLPTVLSRCTMVHLPRLPTNQIARELAAVDSAVDAPHIAEISRGAMGRALSYLNDEERFRADSAVIQQVQGLLQEVQLFQRLRMAAQIAADTDHQELYVRELVHAIRTRLRAGQPAFGEALAVVERLRQRLAANVNAKSAFESLAVELP